MENGTVAGRDFDLQTFQGLILALEDYWAGQGCVLQQPFDMEVGAGTFHPATFLRAIGPEPWSAAYVQPSRRPTDGRYGGTRTGSSTTTSTRWSSSRPRSTCRRCTSARS